MITLKKLFSCLGLITFITFSFYITEKIAIMARNTDPIYSKIKTYNINNTSYVNAIVDGNTVIPGINGKELDEIKSLMNIKKSNYFDEMFLVYNQIPPEISLKDNLDKVIIQGNAKKNSVSLILYSNNNLKSFFKDNNIPISILINNDYEPQKNEEMINNADKSNYDKIEKYLDNNDYNTNICISTSYCPNYKYLVKPTHTLTNNNIIEVKNSIFSGSIILINNSARQEDINILIQKINSLNLSIVKLSDLISESIL